LRFLLLAGAVLLALACSSGTERRAGAASDGTGGSADAGTLARDAEAEDDSLVVPEGLTIMALQGGNGVLYMIALTLLRRGSSGTELYAALRNDDANISACDPGLSVELYDKSSQPMGTWIGGLNTRHFYQLTDAGTVASCAGPGDVTMAALTDLPSDLVIDDVGYVVYRCPYFVLDVIPIDGVTISQVESVAVSGGTAYSGTLVNEFDAAVSSHSVTIFPVNRVGRPLGVATATGADEIPAGGSWQFQTSTVDASAADWVAYPAAALVQ